MHELPLTHRIFAQAMKAAEENGAVRIDAVYLKVGEMRDFIEEITQKYWDHISKGTIAEGAKVRFIRVPAAAGCSSCGEIFNFDWRSKAVTICPKCGSTDAALYSGSELEVVRIAIV
ncbi:hydrogenase maturation nickel metallochaperone HypA/HybF [Youngiibacter fragilis]|uniref:Hydrogenase maturation factor HypA n=1 Tax=Youngiibacter fragilis 232.1 TaxID=994573 RepID=V7HYA7_9CLOT|nr:hydrogenase maturation nickel metallochaperone HypA [Youngiibacter fragilis]ETA78965.1 hydrogenase nickel incorporation protein HypA [Youngiibacter fragilis 232.1]